MCVYIFSGRFQPFHNGHMQVFNQICEQLTPTDTLVLGVVSPFKSEDVRDEDFVNCSEEHHFPDRNPWNVLIPLSAVSHVARSSTYASQIITTLLPRPEYGWKTITSWFPDNRIWVVPNAREVFDNKKSEYFQKMGDRVIRIYDTTDVSGRELREFYKNKKYKEFSSNVPAGLADIYFEKKPEENVKIDFQQRAEKFESRSRWVTDETINNIPKDFLQHHNLGNILDAGGGTGYLSWYLYQTLSNKIKTISLVDLSRNMLDEAETKENYPVQTYNSSIETFCQFTTDKFNTILLRQVLHYVDNVNTVMGVLKNVLSDDGIIYVGQIIVMDKECENWHNELMKDISKNRRRTFVYENFVRCFIQNGFEIIDERLIDYEESFAELFKRRTSNLDKTPVHLKRKMSALTTEYLKETMKIRYEDNNLYFTVKFCHLLLRKKQ